MIHTVTITSKNQITLPISIVKQLNLKKGDQLVLELDNESLSIRTAKSVLKKLAGSVELPVHLKKLSLEELRKRAIQKHFSAFSTPELS